MYGRMFGIVGVEDMFAYAQGSRDGGAAKPNVIGTFNIGCDGGSRGGLGDDILALPAEEGYQATGGVKFEGAELGKGGKAGVGGG